MISGNLFKDNNHIFYLVFVISFFLFLTLATSLVSAVDIIVDDLSANFSTNGTWSSFSNACGYAGEYKYETTTSPPTQIATWQPVVPRDGYYEVFVHYCVHSARPTATPYTIAASNGSTVRTVDQRKDASGSSVPDFTASGWKSLGFFRFTNAGTVTGIENITVDTSNPGDVSADAVKLSGPSGLNVPFPYSTIQLAIDDAKPEEIVNVGAGKYIEQLVISKNLTLLGASASLTVIQAPPVPVGDANGFKNVVTITGSNVNVVLSGFNVSGPGPSGCDSINTGIFVRDGAYANIHDNFISNIRDNPLSGCQNGLGILVGRQSFGTTGIATINNNLVSGYQKGGIVISNSGSTANITRNIVTGVGPTPSIAQNGIQVGDGATGIIQNNTISNNQYTGSGSGNDFYGGWQSGGILSYDAGDTVKIIGNIVRNNDMGIYDRQTAGTALIQSNDVENNLYFGIVFRKGDVTATNNTITGGEIGIFLPSTRPASASDPTANYNSIFGMTVYGIKNDASYNVNAENNWWATNTGPYDPVGTTEVPPCTDSPTTEKNSDGTGDDVSDNVDYCPWITKTVPVVYVDDDFNSTNTDGHIWQFDAFNKIQDGIDAVAIGGTVNVATGIYNKVVDVIKPLTLVGQSGAIIRPDNTTALLDGGIRRAAIYVSGVNNVTIKGFTIDGTAGWVNYGIYPFNSNNTVVMNNVIHDLQNDGYDVGGVGIIYFGWGQGTYNALVQNNTVYNCARMCIFVGGMESGSPYDFLISPNNVIQNNFVNNAWQGPTSDHGGAVQINAGSGSTISGNIINNTGLNQSGIYVTGSPSNNLTILGNNISNDGYGIVLKNAVNNTITGNTISESFYDGIQLYGTSTTLLGNIISQNTIYDSSRHGIILWGNVNNNTITNNFVYNNSYAGIALWNSAAPLPSYNLLYLNKIIKGFTGTSYTAGDWGTSNKWNTTIGNLWSDFYSNPGAPLWVYNVSGTAMSVDYHPIIPLNATPSLRFQYIKQGTPQTVFIDVQTIFGVNPNQIKVQDNSTVSVTNYTGVKVTSKFFRSTFSANGLGNHTVTVYITDNIGFVNKPLTLNFYVQPPSAPAANISVFPPSVPSLITGNSVQFNVTFDRLMDTTVQPTAKLYGRGRATLTGAWFNQSMWQSNFPVPSSFRSGTYTITVSNARDLTGHKMNSVSAFAFTKS